MVSFGFKARNSLFSCKKLIIGVLFFLDETYMLVIGLASLPTTGIVVYVIIGGRG